MTLPEPSERHFNRPFWPALWQAMTLLSVLTALTLYGPQPVLAADPSIEVSGQLSITSGNARSSFDRRRRQISSEVDLTLQNTGQQALAGPLWLVVETTSTQVTQPLASGSWSGPDGNWTPQRHYYDLSGLISTGGLTAGQSVTVHLKFVRGFRVRFTYSSTVYGPDAAAPINQPPIANAGSDQTLTLFPGQTSLDVTLDGSASRDDDGSIASFQWGGVPTPVAEVQPVVNLGEGSHVFTLLVIDNQGAPSTADSVTITVEPADPHAPLITVPPQPLVVFEGESLDVPVSATDADGDAITLSASPSISNADFSATRGAPTNGGLSTPSATPSQASGMLSFSPEHGQQGLYVVSFTARDALGYSTTKSVQILVKNSNRPPTISAPNSVEVDEGGLATILVTTSDPDDDPLTLSATGLPANALFIPATGTISFTPDFDQAGSYNVVVSVDDGSETVTTAISITVNDVATGGGGNATDLTLEVDPVETPTLRSTARITGHVNSQGTPPPQTSARTALITSLNPANGRQGETLVVSLSGQDVGIFATHFLDGSSQAAFGAGIQVNSLSINSPNDAQATISITAGAATGTRSVSITSGDETALSLLAFRVELGQVPLSGVLLDPDTGTPIVGAVVTLEGTTLSTTTGADGSFSFAGVPAGAHVLIINSPNHELLRIEVNAQAGEDLVLGKLEPTPTVFDPSAPPAATLFSVIGRGAADPPGNLGLEQARQLIIDTIIAVGGTEAGVLDAYGNQLNPNVSGEGLVSLRDSGLDELALELMAGDISSVGEVLTRFLLIFDYQGQPVPTMINVRDAIQQELDGGNLLFQVLFNQTRQAGGNPPEVRLDTPLNALQTYLMTSSLLAFVHNQRTAPDAVVQGMPQHAPIMLASAANILGSLVVSDAGSPALLPQAAGEGDLFTIGWEHVFEQAEPTLINNIKSGGVGFCKAVTTVPPPATCGNKKIDPLEECDGTPGCTAACKLAVKPSPPGCKQLADLVQLLVTNKGDAVTQASKSFTNFFLDEGATAAESASLRQAYQSKDFQAAWQESSKEARNLGKIKGFLNISADFVKGQLASIGGAMLTTILSMESKLIVDSLRPDPPLITNVEQLPNPDTGELSNRVRITFKRSLKDRGADSLENVVWFYGLWRQHTDSFGRITSGRVRTPEQGPGPRPTGDPRTLVFYDNNAPEGTVSYRIRATRMIGAIVNNPPPNSLLADMISGIFPLNFSTPGGVTVMGADALKIVLSPVSQILRGLNQQRSPFSDPGPIFVSLTPRPPAPPAQLATDRFGGSSYVSIPVLGTILKVEDGNISVVHDSLFKGPEHQIGLGIDHDGTLYTDNAASDSRFSGRLFSIDGDTGGRVFIGSVNYYSLMLQFGRSVAVTSMAVGPGRFGESLYIADALNQRITELPIGPGSPNNPASHNVSQPYVSSEELSFGPDTAMAFTFDGALYITQGKDIFRVPSGGSGVDPLFDDVFAPSPFSQLTGIAADRRGNLYVSDASLNTIYQIPFNALLTAGTLSGYSAVDLKKLAIIRGFVRPSQVQLAPSRRGLVFVDANGFQSIGFGMSGQVTDTSGTPLPAAKVIVTDTVPSRGSVTDGDGIYVLPDLLGNTSNVVDVTIRHGGRTQTQRVVLTDFTHSIRDFVFDPPDPPSGSGPNTITPPADPPPPPVEVDLVAGETVVIEPQTTLQTVTPSAIPAPGNEPPRAYLLSPGADMVVTSDSTRVQGFVTDPSITEGTLLVNGERQAVTLNNGKFDKTVNLRDGENEIALEVKEGGVKGELVGAAVQAAADTLTEMDDVLAGFGTGVANTWGLAGKSLQEQFSELPEGYRASLELTAAAGAIQVKAQAAVTRLANRILPSTSELVSLSNDLAAIEVHGDASELHRVASTAIRTTYDATAARIEQARQQISQAQSRLVADKGLLEGHFADIMATFPAGPERDAVTDALGAAALAQGDMIAFYDQQQLPETLSAHEMTHQIQQLTSAIDTHGASFSAEQQATLADIRSLAEDSNQRTRGDHNALSIMLGDTLGDMAALAGSSIDSVANQIADSSITPEIRQAAAAVHTSAESGLASFTAGRLPGPAALGSISTRIAELGQQATTDASAIVEGMAQALQRRSNQAQGELQAGLLAFSQGHDLLASSFQDVEAKVSAVEGMGLQSLPKSFSGVSGELGDSLTGILGALDTKQLPQRELVGDPDVGLPGKITQRLNNLDQMFTVRSPVTSVNKTDASGAVLSRIARGFDTMLSGVLRDRNNGRPVAGEQIGVPGQAAMSATTNRDGVFQVRILTQQLTQLVEQTNQRIQLQSDRMLQIIQNNIRGGAGSSAVNEGLSELILEAARIQDDPPSGLPGGDAIAAIASQIEDLMTNRLADVEAGRELTDPQIDEIQVKVQEIQGLFGELQGVLKSLHDASLSIIATIR